MNKTLDEKLKEFESKFNVVWKYTGSREQFLKEVGADVGFINNHWRSRDKGIAVDIEDVFISKAKTSNHTKTKNFTTQYVSIFQKRSAETQAAHKEQMKKILESDLAQMRYEFKSLSHKERLIDILSENFLATDSNEGVVYRKIHNNHIPGGDEFSIDILIKKLGADRYLDSDKTELAQSLYRHEVRMHAEKIAGDPKNEKLMAKATDLVKRVNDGFRVGKTLQYNESDVYNDIKGKFIVDSGKSLDKMSLHETNMIHSATVLEINNNINSLDNIRKAVNDIEAPAPSSSAWDFN